MKTIQKPMTENLTLESPYLRGALLLHGAAINRTSKLERGGLKSLLTKVSFKGWEGKIFFPEGFIIFLHAALMARAEFGCVSQHEMSSLARLRPKRPAWKEFRVRR